MRFVEAVIRSLFLTIASALFDLYLAWMAMLWLGIAHGFDSRVPAFGYWTCYFVLWALCAPITSVRFAVELRKAVEP